MIKRSRMSGRAVYIINGVIRGLVAITLLFRKG